MRKNLLFAAILVGTIFSFNSTSIASSEGVETFARVQNQLKISFIECAIKLRLHYISDEKAQQKKFAAEAAKCLARLKNAVAVAANSYKETTRSANAQKLIEIWQNGYFDIINTAIKRQLEESMPEKIIDLINITDKMVLANIRDIKTGEKSFYDKILEADKWPDGSPIANKS